MQPLFPASFKGLLYLSPDEVDLVLLHREAVHHATLMILPGIFIFPHVHKLCHLKVCFGQIMVNLRRPLTVKVACVKYYSQQVIAF